MATKKIVVKPKQYRGNINLKPIGYNHNWTQHEVEEYQKCADDPIYFIENYVYITTLDEGLKLFKLYPYQAKLITTIHDSRKVVARVGRQLGKCATFETEISIQNKKTMLQYKVKIGDFHKWIEFKETYFNLIGQ